MKLLHSGSTQTHMINISWMVSQLRSVPCMRGEAKFVRVRADAELFRCPKPDLQAKACPVAWSEVLSTWKVKLISAISIRMRLINGPGPWLRTHGETDILCSRSDSCTTSGAFGCSVSSLAGSICFSTVTPKCRHTGLGSWWEVGWFGRVKLNWFEAQNS